MLSLAWSPKKLYIASGGGKGDNAVRLWDSNTGKDLFDAGPLGTHDGEVKALAWSPGGNFVVSGSSAGDIHFWDTRKGKPAYEHRNLSASQFPRSTHLAIGHTGGMVTIWEPVDKLAQIKQSSI